MYEINASFPGGGEDRRVACCFVPRIVVVLLREHFAGEVEVDPTDHAWKDYKLFLRMGDAEGAAGIAERDALRRGPNYCFRFPRSDGQLIRGNAERYIVRILSDDPIPEPLKSRFEQFLRGLPLVPFEVRSVRIEENTVTDV